MQRDIQALQSQDFDVAIIGAGIHGACAARDAALRGLKVALIDQGDLSGATSHNSLKTIHGGIRYLQHLNIKRTLESIREQKIWLRTAPHLVKPLAFLMPTYGHGMRGPLVMAIGIRVFELLGFGRNRHLRKDRKIPFGRVIGQSACLEKAPDIKTDNLTGGAIWYDAQVEYADKAVLQICDHAVANGAVVANYVKAQSIQLDDTRRVTGLRARDQLNGEDFEIRANVVLNAAGPWALELLKDADIHSLQQPSLPLTKSMNLVTTKPAPDYAVSVQSKLASDSKVGASKRLYFVVPWQGQAMLGTTHFPHQNGVDTMQYEPQEVQDFVDEINQAYPSYNLSIDDVSYCYQGLTPAEEDDQGKATRSHHSKVIDHRADGVNGQGVEGLVSIISIKWTTARLVAERAINAVCQKIGNTMPCQTHKVSIPDGLALHDQFADLSDSQLISTAQAHIEKTMALCLLDMLTRRSNDFVKGKLSAEQIRLIGNTMAATLAWDVERKQQELDKLLSVWLPQRLRQQLTSQPFWNET